MAAPVSNIDRIVSYLLHVTERSVKNRLVTERFNQDCRQLLKPWPKVQQVDKQEPGVQDSTQSEGNKEDAISAEEAEDIQRLQCLLDKAQKARETQAKKEAKAAQKRPLSTSKPPLPPITAAEKLLPVENKENTAAKHKLNSHDIDSAVINKSALDKLLHGTKGQKPGSSRVNSVKTASTGKGQTGAASTRQRPGQSVNKQTYKTSSSEIGKHLKMKQSGIQKSGSQTRKSQPNSRSSSAERSGVSRSRSLERESQRSDSTKDAIQTLDTKGCTNEKSTGQSDTESISGRLSSLNIGEDSGRGVKQVKSLHVKESGEKEKAEMFLLRKDGSNLKIPNRLKKLCSSNYKHREKVTNLVAKHPQSRKAEHFIEKVKSSFQTEVICLSDEDLERQLENMKREYDYLIKITETTLKDMSVVTEESEWQDLYRTKVAIDQLKRRYREIQEEIQVLIMGEQQLLNGCVCGDCRTVQEHFKQVHAQQTSYNLLPQTQHVKGLTTEKEASSNFIVYNNAKQLKHMVSVQHDIVLLQLNICIQKILSEEVLPLLQDLDPKDDSYVSLYRTVYSLVYNDGQLLPTMIQDHDEDDSDSPI